MTRARIHLVRHGQSTWNRAGRLQGHTAHPPLTQAGRLQARQAAAVLAGLVGPGPVALWSSDLERARQTAEVIGARLGVPVGIDPALREQGIGAESESAEEVRSRVATFVTGRLAGRHGHLVLVSHGETIRQAEAWWTERSGLVDLPVNGAVLTLPARVAAPAQ